MAEVPPFLWSDSGSFASPVLYTVPGAGEVQPYTATATYVNASGQAILPALRIKSDSGNLLALTFPVGQTIADGTSSEVTFVPPFGSAQQVSPATGGSGLPNAVMKKTLQQTVAGNHVTQLGLDSSTFATTDGTIFSASGSNIAIAATGLYAAYIDMVNDVTDEDASMTQLYPKWLQTNNATANFPWEQIVPRIYNNAGPAGLQGFMPDGAGLSQNIDNWSIAYCSGTGTTVGAWLATLSPSSVTTSTVLLAVIQLQAITSATLATFPTYPN